MFIPERSLKVLILSTMVLTLIAFVTRDANSQEVKKQLIEFDNYTVEAPLGGNWEADIKKETGKVQFVRQRKSFFGGGLPKTIIHISYTSVLKEEMWKMSAEEIANDYRDGEKIDMMVRGALQGMYELHDLKEDVATLGEKKLYTLSYKQMGGKSFGSDKMAESILYLYFPPDFMKTHTFYRLLISEFKKRDDQTATDLTPIIPVINSLQVK